MEVLQTKTHFWENVFLKIYINKVIVVGAMIK
jgi:hypothetical protein